MTYKTKKRLTVLQCPSWSEVPKVPKGYVLDSESVENGTIENTFTGNSYRYQSYRITKERKKE